MSAALSWTEVRVLAPLGWHELIAEALCIGPCTSAAFGRRGLVEPIAPEGWDYVRSFLPSTVDSDEQRDAIRAAIEALSESTGAPELAGLTVDFKPLPPEDYATSWRKSWKPFRLGSLCLLPPWDERAVREGELRLTIEPGGAFGSGRHATTRACLRSLMQRLEPGQRLLDAGSGSGILCVAAALLGAESALGFDLDPVAEVAGDELARANGVADRCRFRTGGFEALGPDDRGFDAVLSNIYADVIQEHAADLATRLRPGGWFTFSGCSAPHAAATRAAISTAGLTIEDESVRGRWHTFAGRRPSA